MTDAADPILTVSNRHFRDPSDFRPYIAPLSCQQKNFWGLCQTNVGMRLNISIVLRLLGRLNEEILRSSFELVIGRHEALRTRIRIVDGVPRQLIDPPGHYHLETQSIPCPPLEADRLQPIVDEFLRMPFDLVEGKLFKARLIRLSSGDSILLANIHHIIMDGFSVGILFGELWRYYGAMSRQTLPDIPEPRAQYSDYAIWQEDTRSAWLEEHAQYWKERLYNAKPLQFPVDHRLVSDVALRGKGEVSLLPFRFDESLTAGIYSAARREGTMPALIVLASYVVLLWRWCNQSEFLVIMYIAGRDIPEYVDTIGFFVDILPLRMEITGGETFKDLLAEVIREVCMACEHRSHSRLLTEATLGCVESTISTGFNWTPGSYDVLAGCPDPGIAEQLEGEIRVERFPCMIPQEFPELDESSRFAAGIIWMYPGTVITGSLGYNTSVFSNVGAEALIDNLKIVVGRLTSDSKLSISMALSELGS